MLEASAGLDYRIGGFAALNHVEDVRKQLDARRIDLVHDLLALPDEVDDVRLLRAQRLDDHLNRLEVRNALRELRAEIGILLHSPLDGGGVCLH